MTFSIILYNQPRKQHAKITICPYKFKGSWVFDSPGHGLDKEAFVQGADKILDYVTKNINGAEDGFVLSVSSTPMVGSMYILSRLGSEFGELGITLMGQRLMGGYVQHCLSFSLLHQRKCISS